MRIVTLLAFLMYTGLNAHGQNLIGYSGKEIQKYMKENRQDMNFEKVVNDRFKYLKYSANSDNQTLLFFLTNDSICKSVSIICDLASKQEKIKEFDAIYKRSEENKWADTRDGKNYLIKLKDEKWSCVITIEADK